MRTEQYKITGMMCAACSASVERVTSKLDGVLESNVNLTTERMRIVYDEAQVSSEKIIEKVQKAGFGCEFEELLSSSESMTENALVQQENDKSESVNSGQFTEKNLGQSESGLINNGIENRTSNVNKRQEKRKQEQLQNRKEIKRKKNRLIATMAFAVLLLYVSMGHMLPVPLPLPPIIDMHKYPVNFALTQFIFTIPILALNYELFGRHEGRRAGHAPNIFHDQHLPDVGQPEYRRMGETGRKGARMDGARQRTAGVCGTCRECQRHDAGRQPREGARPLL